MSEDKKENKLLGNKSTRLKKEALLEALEKNMGIVTQSCKQLDIGRQTYYDWINEDEEFKRRVEGLKNVALDFAESKLMGQIDEGNTTSIIFFLKCKGRERGYVERQDIDHTTQGDKIAPNVIHLGSGKKPNEEG